MNLAHPISLLGELIGEPARTAILIELLDGRDLSAGELAVAAGISAQSASAHLSKLVDGGLLKSRRQGRNHYFKISAPQVAYALEALGAISTLPRPLGATRSLKDMEVCRARSCYDHLAGQVGVGMTRALENLKVIRFSSDREYEIGPKGAKWLEDFEIDVDAARISRRAFARRCLDWTERKPHLAGALGAALFTRMLASRWLARRRGTRALRVTDHGAREFKRRFGIHV
jgi:DNA-binding transcriptional ArsR family regulator